MIDASIPLQVKPIQIDSPMDAYSKALAVQHLTSQNALAGLQLQQGQNALALQNSVAQAMQDSGGDMGKAIEKIRSLPGGASLAIQMQKDMREGQKTESDTARTRAETVLKYHDIIGSGISGLLADPDVQSGSAAAMDKTFSAIRGLKAQGIPEKIISGALNSMPGDPAKLKQWLTTIGAQNAQTAEQALKLVTPQVDFLNTGGAQVPVNKNPLSGPVGPMTGVTPVANTMTAEQVADRPLKKLQAENLRGEIAKRGNELNDAALKQQAAISTGQDTLGVIDKALTHPGLPIATGVQGTVDPRNYIPGTRAKDFQSVLDQIKGQAFMQAYQNLRGGGQITEVEGKKATDAIARLNTTQSTEEFKNSLNELRGIMQRGLERLQAQQPVQTGQPAANSWQVPPATQAARDANAGQLIIQEYGSLDSAKGALADLDRTLKSAKGDAKGMLTGERNRLAAGIASLEGKPKQEAAQSFASMPDPAGLKGKTIQDDQSGVRYQSDGTKWVRVK